MGGVTTELSDHAAKPRRAPPAATMSLIDKVMQLAEYGGEDEHSWLLLEPEARRAAKPAAARPRRLTRLRTL